jgi:hypothetical protein
MIILFFIPSSPGFLNTNNKINVAIIRQNWDMFDSSPSSYLSTQLHKKCLKSAENKYNVTFKIYEFWDYWNHGDVQKGLLNSRNIDVIIAPGGIGGWNTPFKYRQKIRQFVRNGGGFYGICGDSTFGSLGVKNLNWGYKKILCRILDLDKISPMLGLANVYTDASSIKYIIKNPFLFPKLNAIQFIFNLPISRGVIHINRCFNPIQKPYFGENIRVMLGNPPLIEGDFIKKITMPKVYTIAVYKQSDNPYDQSIKNKKAIICTDYGKGRVVLSPIHAEYTIGNKKAHDIYIRNIIWLASKLFI